MLDMVAQPALPTCLKLLDLPITDAARLLSVSARTVRRWVERPDEVPGPALQAVRAWVRLKELGVGWRPDAMPIGPIDEAELAEQIKLRRQHAVDLDRVLERVRARGGPAAPWSVSLSEQRATLGPVWVSFYFLPGGSFAPAFFGRSDKAPDDARDRELIDDAIACIAKALAVGQPR